MTLRKKVFSLLFVLASCFQVRGQDVYKVSEIRFSGTEKVRGTFLLKNIHTRVGDKLSLKSLEKDLLSLTQLPPVAKSSYKIDTLSANEVEINYILEDAITFIPGVYLGNRGENLWWGVGITSLNLFRCGHQVALNYTRVDKEHNVDLFYKVPFIGETRWAIGGSLYRRGSVEPLFFNFGSYNYRYAISGFSAFPEFRFTPRHSISLPVNVFQESYNLETELDINEVSVPVNRIERKVLMEVVHKLSDIEYDYFLQKGRSNRLALQWVRSFTDRFNFFSLVQEYKHFWRLGKNTNIALRVKGNIATNNSSPFAPFVLDNDSNIRGVGARALRGTAEVVTNLEWRQTIFSYGRFAGQAVIFTDAGMWRVPGGDFSDFVDPNIRAWHYGLGLRGIYTRGHNYIFRIDYGVDAFKHFNGLHGLVIGIGQYF